MNQKLTLSVEQEAIARGKRFAARNNVSLSSVVESFLVLLDDDEDVVLDVPVSSKLRSLVGIGAGSSATDDYQRHLEKHYA